ncbi:MAG: alpha/beta fold hydrolase [Candidatus Paceibacterota bacterium]|jgi:hypothetical protein
MKKQLVSMGGGDSFRNYKEYLSYLKKKELYFEGTRMKIWRENLPEALGKGFEVINLRMPSPDNARYKEWKIWFNKLVPFLRKDVMLLGHSLGGIFLAKYLAENKFPRKIKAVFLVAAPFKEHGKGDILGDFNLPKSLNKINQAENIFLYQSKDDSIVPYKDALEYKKSLPKAKLSLYKNKGHFIQKNFPEIVKNIKSL